MRTDATTLSRPEIRPLDPALINKIAAGEVIERPSSVVKELVENSLDAGAKRVDVTLEVGGSQLIRVVDDGHGIAREHLPLAIAPHATSKIATADDLFNIHTLGFRGEALASIGSVSQLSVRSRPADQLEAFDITVDGGAVSEPVACGAPVGTTVEIRNLFFNVPARRKFLRTPQTECGHVTEQIARLALAHPQTAFTLTHNGRSLRNLPPTADRRERIADFYGSELGECLIPLDRHERGLRIEGLIAPPSHSKATTKWQYLFLNGRHITDRRLTYAIREAFRGLVEHDRFPVVFLFLTADPHDFDANVHPTKIEVRWKDAGLVQSQVLAVLRETLLSRNLTPRLRTPNAPPADIGNRPSDPAAQQRAREALANYLKRVDPTQPRLTFRAHPFAKDRLRPSIIETLPSTPEDAGDSHAANVGDAQGERGMLANGGAGLSRDAAQPTHDGVAPAALNEATSADVASGNSSNNDGGGSGALGPNTAGVSAATPNAEGQAVAPNAAAALSALAHAGGSDVMQLHNTYLVCQTEDGVLIIDQHALHERILYERFRERILRGPLESQGMLLPETFEASPAQREAATANADLLDRIGIEVTEYGPKLLAVQRFPTLLRNVSMKTFVSDLLDKLVDNAGQTSEETLIHAALDMMACKAAVKAGDPLSREEIYALLEQRHLTERSSNCPHGRPTTLELTTKDLERQFGRA